MLLNMTNFRTSEKVTMVEMHSSATFTGPGKASSKWKPDCQCDQKFTWQFFKKETQKCIDHSKAATPSFRKL